MIGVRALQASEWEAFKAFRFVEDEPEAVEPE